MRIIKPATVNGWAARHADAADALERWMTGRRVVVFNIGGNKYRLIAAVHYNTQIVHAMLFMTHSEYDKEKWKKVLQ